MGVAACFVWLVLASVVYIAKLANRTLDPDFLSPSLTVRIEHHEAGSELQTESAEPVDASAPRENTSVTETVTVPVKISPSASPVLHSEEPPVEDWQSTIAESLASIEQDRQAQEEIRSQMWRKTHSVMFQSDGGFEPQQPEPIIPEFQFKPQVHVAGLGVTIGSCFIGIPIVGVPVEERTVAIRLFVCAGD